MRPTASALSAIVQVGGALFVLQMNAPYLVSGGVMVALSLVIGWKALAGRR